MFAVIELNDKQFLVEEGDIFTVDGIISTPNIVIDKVLLIQDKKTIEVGEPYVEKASVQADVLETGKREKDVVFKFKRKTGYKLTRGHRQNTTVLKIKTIELGG